LSWSPWHRYSNWGVRRHAEKDGKLGIPKVDQTLNPPFVMQRKHIGDQGVKDDRSEWLASTRLDQLVEESARQRCWSPVGSSS
jgi:hypothetical protein